MSPAESAQKEAVQWKGRDYDAEITEEYYVPEGPIDMLGRAVEINSVDLIQDEEGFNNYLKTIKKDVERKKVFVPFIG